jgi:DNA excision repair protein ERCC-2
LKTNANNTQVDFPRFWQNMSENFPYPQYRNEQLQIINKIHENPKKFLMIDAETGSGKTAAVLSGVLSKLGNTERVLIFTKMLSQMDAWFRELGLINDLHRKLKINIYSLLPLIARYRICNNVTQRNKKQFRQVGCSLFDCSFDKTFYAITANDPANLSYRLIEEISNDVREGVSLSEVLFNISNISEQFGCPYKSLKEALRFSRIIITSYPFLLNHRQRDILFSAMDLDLADTTIIIDEAHNLAKSTFSDLSYKILTQAINEIGYHKVLEKLLAYKGEPGLHILNFTDDELTDLQNQGKRYVLEMSKKGFQDVSSTIKVYEFLLNLDNCFLTADKRTFTLYLRDPRKILNSMQMAKQILLLSGTFRPLDHFADFIGIQQANKISVFSQKLGQNRIILTTNDPNLSMKYQERSPDRYLYYSQTIKKLANAIQGHTLVFTPNYEITTVLANSLQTSFYEKPHQTATKLKEAIVSSPKKEIIIAPARGKISEGVEFVKQGKSIIAAVIIAGLPYPPPSQSLNAIINEYSKFWGQYRATNYMTYLQAIVSMRQALGRMIRSENDIGAWIILDNRISYIDIFPRAIECKNTDQMVTRLNFFYNKHNMLQG